MARVHARAWRPGARPDTPLGVSWWRDRGLWAAVGVGTLLRAVPLAVWADDVCVRDECTYIRLADRLADGAGMTSSVGWLWAPGYPALMAIPGFLFGHPGLIKIPQVLVAGLVTALLYRLTQRVFAAARPGATPEALVTAGRVAAFGYALSLHQAFFAIRLWSEVIYSAVLLGVFLMLDRARRGAEAEDGASAEARRLALTGAAGLGALVGICVLFRGVAQYMLPVFAVGLLWGQWRRLQAWAQVGLMAACTAAVVAPYSVYATQKFDTFILSDRTLGQMMYLGNNDYDPVAFDYGNGKLSRRAFDRERRKGRLPCAPRGKMAERDACQTAEAVAWVKANPGEFLRRVPLRMAQMTTPHSLLTRHLRWGRFKGIPWWGDELIIALQAFQGVLVQVVGAAALTLRGQGARGLAVSGVLLYHLAAVGALAGISRYRVPLEPLLMVGLAILAVDPAGTRASVAGGRWRLPLLVLVLSLGIPLVLWFLPAGWPEWRAW
jgi:hypothetical protein